MFKGELHCLQECFRKQTGKENVNPQYEDQASVHDDSLILNVIVFCAKKCI